MAGANMSAAPSSVSADQQRHPVAFSVMTTVFFMWGFITCLNDILIPHLKGAFELNYTQAMLIQFCFFGAYLFDTGREDTAPCRLQAGRDYWPVHSRGGCAAVLSGSGIPNLRSVLGSPVCIGVGDNAVTGCR